MNLTIDCSCPDPIIPRKGERGDEFFLFFCSLACHGLHVSQLLPLHGIVAICVTCENQRGGGVAGSTDGHPQEGRFSITQPAVAKQEEPVLSRACFRCALATNLLLMGDDDDPLQPTVPHALCGNTWTVFPSGKMWHHPPAASFREKLSSSF